MSEKEWTEKRRFKRFPAEGVIEIVVLDKDSAKRAISRPAMSQNMSVGGVLLTTDKEIPVDSTVLLKLDFAMVTGSSQKRIIEAVGRVARGGATEKGYEIGVCFEGVSEGDAEALRLMVE